MVGTKQKWILSSSAKNVVVEDQGFRKTLDCHVVIVNRESPAATAAGRQDPVINSASHAQAMRIEAPSTWVQDRDLAISRGPCPGDGEGQNLGLHNPMKKTGGDIRLPSSSLGPSGIHKSGSGHGSPDPVDGNDCSQVLVGVGFQSSDPRVISTVTEASNTLTEPKTVTGGSGLTLKGSGYDTPDSIVGGNGGRLLDAVVGVSKLVTATTRKDNDLPMPMRSSRRGKVSGSNPLNGSDKSVEQDAEDFYGFFGPSIERNVYNGLKGQRPTNNQKEYKKPRPTRQRKNRQHLPYKYRKRGISPKQTNNHQKTDQPKHKPTTRAEKKQPKTPPTALAKATKDQPSQAPNQV